MQSDIFCLLQKTKSIQNTPKTNNDQHTLPGNINSQKKLRLNNRTLRSKVLKILGEHIYIATKSGQQFERRMKEMEKKEQRNKLSNYLERVSSKDFKKKQFTIQLSDKLIPNIKSQRMSLPVINVDQEQQKYSKVKQLCSFLTLEEALEVSEDPYYYICADKFREDEELLNYEAWGQIYNEVQQKLKARDEPLKLKMSQRKPKSLNTSELRLYCTELKSPELLQFKIEKGLEEANNKKEEYNLQKQKEIKKQNEMKFLNFQKNWSSSKERQNIKIDIFSQQIQQKKLKAQLCIDEIKENVEGKKIFNEQNQINKNQAFSLRLKQSRQAEEMQQMNIILKELCKSRQVKADKQVQINIKKEKAQEYQELRQKQQQKNAEKSEIDELLSHSSDSNK